MSKKIITIEIQNSHLDALEDLLFTELTEEQEKESREQAKQLWQSLVDAYEKQKQLLPREKFNAYKADLAREKNKRKKPDLMEGRYELSYWLHELEIGETHFIERSKWVSKKDPSEKLRRIRRKTEKSFSISRHKDGSGWSVKRDL